MKQPSLLSFEIFSLLFLLGIVAVGVSAILFFAPSAPAYLAVTGNPSATSSLESIWKTPSGKNPQFIVFAFDGSRSLDMWEATRAFARHMKKEGKPIDFTYFINADYFLADSHRGSYQAPRHPAGRSGIGFGGSPAEIEKRIAEVNSAYAEGNEIGSHTAGHYPGAGWSAAEWNREFSSFDDLLFHIHGHNPEIPDSSGLDFPRSAIFGFRAPDLSVSPGLDQALSDNHFAYDASLAGDGSKWPYKTPQGLWEFPLGSVKLGSQWTLAMDFNFYIDQTGGRDIARKGTPLWNSLFDSVQNAYADYFNHNYSGNRAPIYIANHFSLWNGGLYWEGLKAFAEKECGKPEVHCVSYKELAGYLDAMPKKNAALAR